MSRNAIADLAVNGGTKTITKPLPGRSHFGKEERKAADKLLDACEKHGVPFGYQGRAEADYCAEFTRFMGGGYADGVNSGTTALYVALKAVNPEPFTEVIVSAITDPGGIMPIPLMNCIPIIADTGKSSYNTNAPEVEKLISRRTSAIVIAHIGGEPADIANIVKLAHSRGIPVIEDCAQAHGARLLGKPVGSFGDIAAFSTMFGKHHCTGGQGGVVFTKNEKLHWNARRAADRGKPFNLPQGSTNCVATLNFNLDELSAAIGSAQLAKLPRIVKKRQKFAEILAAKGFNDLKSVSIPKLAPGAESAYWWWRIKFNARAMKCSKMDFCRALMAEGVLLNPDYSAALPFTFDWFKKRNVFGTGNLPWSSPSYKGNPDRQFKCPNALEAVASHFNLTINESWGAREANLIIKAFRKVEAAYSS